MRMIVAVGLGLAFGVVVTVACSGPGPTNDACTNTGAVCQSASKACYESLSLPCNAAPNLVCCAPGAQAPTPTGTSDAAPTSTGTGPVTTPDAATSGG